MPNNFDATSIPSELTAELGIDIFVNELIKQKKEFEGLSEDVLLSIKEDLKTRVESYLNISLLKYIPENKLDDFETAIDTNYANIIQAFCKKNIPNLTQVVALSLVNFRETYLGTHN